MRKHKAKAKASVGNGNGAAKKKGADAGADAGRMFVPRLPASQASAPARPLLGLSSTYLKKANDVFPHAGTGVWAPRTNYFQDMWKAGWGDLRTDLEFR